MSSNNSNKTRSHEELVMHTVRKCERNTAENYKSLQKKQQEKKPDEVIKPPDSLRHLQDKLFELQDSRRKLSEIPNKDKKKLEAINKWNKEADTFVTEAGNEKFDDKPNDQIWSDIRDEYVDVVKRMIKRLKKREDNKKKPKAFAKKPKPQSQTSKSN